MRDIGDVSPIGFVPADWMADAACKGMDTNLFFPEQGGSNKDALAACAVCTVKAECAQYCDDMSIRSGVWGGMSERQRRSVRNGGVVNSEHGTISRYNWGCRCDACKTAKADRRIMLKARAAAREMAS